MYWNEWISQHFWDGDLSQWSIFCEISSYPMCKVYFNAVFIKIMWGFWFNFFIGYVFRSVGVFKMSSLSLVTSWTKCSMLIVPVHWFRDVVYGFKLISILSYSEFSLKVGLIDLSGAETGTFREKSFDTVTADALYPCTAKLSPR